MTDTQTILVIVTAVLGGVALGAWIGRLAGRIEECNLKDEIAEMRYLRDRSAREAEYYKRQYEELTHQQRNDAAEFGKTLGVHLNRILRKDARKAGRDNRE